MNTRQIQLALYEDGLQEVDVEYLLAQERNEEIQGIERGVIETNALFKDVQALVVEQGEQVDNIEANVHRSVSNTKTGIQSLQEAERLQRGCTIL